MSATATAARPATRERELRVGLAAGAALASIALGAIGYRVLVRDHGQDTLEAAAQVVMSWTFVAAGLVAWWRRPASRVGALLVAGGIALLLRRLQYSDQSALFTFGFAFGELSNVLIAHAVLAYPTGKLRSKAERALIAVSYPATILFPLATLLVFDRTEACLFDCDSAERAGSLLLVHGDPEAVAMVRDAFRITVFGVLGLVFLVLVARKLVQAGPAGRRLLAPLLVAAIAGGIRIVSEGGLTFATYSEDTRQLLFWWQVTTQAAVPVALLVGLLQARLTNAALADLLPRLARSSGREVRDVLARSLNDPRLEIAYWVPDRQSYVDAGGTPLVPDAQGRAVTPVDRNGEPIAALIHDSALAEEPELVHAAAAAARLALENARLTAEVQAQLSAVKESRARIAAAADAERRRIERDLHDGAQQRLLALALELSKAESRNDDLELRRLLASAVRELRAAIEELRELSRGIHPTLLVEGGLEAAISALAARAPIPVEVSVALDRRPQPSVESAAYFLVSEALTNVARHAWASSASVSVGVERGCLAVEVRDDGVGGADERGGGGLCGLADRLEALGGRLLVESPRDGGTRVRGEIPCAS